MIMLERPARPNLTRPNLYNVLEVSADAGNDEIRDAYRRLDSLYHPSRAGTQKEEKAKKFMLIHEAFVLLTNPVFRACYEPPEPMGQDSAENSNGGKMGAHADAPVTILEQTPAPPAYFPQGQSLLAQSSLPKQTLAVASLQEVQEGNDAARAKSTSHSESAPAEALKDDALDAVSIPLPRTPLIRESSLHSPTPLEGEADGEVNDSVLETRLEVGGTNGKSRDLVDHCEVRNETPKKEGLSLRNEDSKAGPAVASHSPARLTIQIPPHAVIPEDRALATATSRFLEPPVNNVHEVGKGNDSGGDTYETAPSNRSGSSKRTVETRETSVPQDQRSKASDGVGEELLQLATVSHERHKATPVLLDEHEIVDEPAEATEHISETSSPFVEFKHVDGLPGHGAGGNYVTRTGSRDMSPTRAKGLTTSPPPLLQNQRSPLVGEESSGSLFSPSEWVYPLPLSLEILYHGGKLRYKVTRYLLTGKSIQVLINIDVKRGWRQGTRIRFAGLGNERAAPLPAQDVTFVVEELPHPMYRREGAHLYMVQDISLLNVLAETEHAVMTLGGEEILVDVDHLPGGIIRPGHVSRVVGKGMPKRRRSKLVGHGDLFISWNVLFPMTLSEQQRNFLRLARDAVEPDMGLAD